MMRHRNLTSGRMAHRNLLMFYSLPVIQVLMGLSMGVAISMIAAPFWENSCYDQPGMPFHHHHPSLLDKAELSDARAQVPNEGDRQINFVRNAKLKNDFESAEYVPRHIQSDARQIHERAPSVDSSRRARYISTELGIREKLFVGVLSSKESLETFGVVVNRTLAHYVTKLVFFMNLKKSALPSGVSLVIFNDEKIRSVALKMLKYVASHYYSTYDWFFFMRDDTYVRGKELYDLISELSISSDILMGFPRQDQRDNTKYYCDLGPGILLSQNMMNEVIKKLDWCSNNIVHINEEMTTGQCILQATGQSCSNFIHGQPVTFYTTPSFNFDHEMEQPEGLGLTLPTALSVSRIQDDVNMYKLHRYFCEKDLDKVEKELQDAKKHILKLSPMTPDEAVSRSWPLGVDPPTLPKTRFDVILWEYFTETDVYLESDFSNTKELRGVHKEDVNDIIKVSMEKLNKKYSGRYVYRQLVNGYRRFDAARGMEYILDLSLLDRSTRSETTKRVQLMRPLGAVELVPMPYVTENSRVNLILPVVPENRDSVVSLLDSYAQTCLESGDNTYLFVVFVYRDEAAQLGGNDIYSVLKSMISFYENKYQNGARIAWTAVQNNNPSQYSIMDTVSRKFPPESLLLLASVGMELSIEFLNRVRMNTIAGWQVFFPIGFWQYKPNLVHQEKPYPTSLDIDQKIGHFDSEYYVHTSFYNNDYQYARKQMHSTSASRDIDLYDMFLKYHTLHVFRAVEPALKLRYQPIVCQPSADEESYSRCLSRRGQGLASRAQLAMLIFEHQQKLDQLQMNVLHQQDGPNVGQMKPDMLR